MSRLLTRWFRRLRRLAEAARSRRRARKGVEVAPDWPRRRGSFVIQALVYLGGLLFVLWVGRALSVVISGKPNTSLPLDADSGCAETGFSCGVMGGIVMTLLSLALGSAIFLVRRLRHIRGAYVRHARNDPAELMPTAGTVIGEIVGRDELCNVIMDDLRDRDGRRPHIIIGGVGTGKTAVLVQLTRVLAKNGAVPVPIRLRDAQGEIDFRGLARARFIAHAESGLLSSGEGEKIWRQLCKDDQIVVLADGLEEAFAASDSDQDRDNLIRLAIAQAQRQNLPLVIASRPHDPLSGMKAAMLDLEPLSEEAALEYLRGNASVLDERLEWLVETAAVADAPLYLQIAKELHGKGLLRHAHPAQRTDRLDTRGVDRVALRLRLIDTWMRALTKGHFHAELALSSADRSVAIEHLSALACIGLGQDSLHVKFEDLVGSDTPSPSNRARAAQSADVAPQSPGHPGLKRAVEERLGAVGQSRSLATKPRLNCAISATIGMQLGLVEPYRDGVRFQHSIMQAYLGSRVIAAVADDKEFMQAALTEPGRELLMAMVLYSRSRFGEDADEDAPPARLVRGSSREPRHAAPLRDVICAAANDRPLRDAKTLDMLASAIEIDAVVSDPIHTKLARNLAALWAEISVSDRTVEEAKLRAVARFGDAARTVAVRAAGGEAVPKPAYAQLFDIGSRDESYRVRVAAAHEIGVGGDLGFDALRRDLAPTPGALVASTRPAAHGENDDAPGGDLDPDALDDAAPTAPPAVTVAQSAEDELERRRETMRAWLAPMLVGSANNRAEAASRNLDRWLSHVGSQQSTSAGCLPLAVEVALAQGFKHAANRRPEHPLVRAEARDDLAERAREMLEKAKFWYSRLTLVHALCLWALPETPSYKQGRKRASPPPGTDPAALVDRWLSLPDSETGHPFVNEARKLAVLALESGRPERFIWIDESGVVTKVGTYTARYEIRRRHELWIPPSTGWSTLHPRAQQLVGDVLLLLNLAERGQDPTVRDRRLNRARRNELPPCLSSDRSPLNPTQTVGTARTSAPGSNCKHGCKFDLCPYPPKGEQAYRSELSEAFCRRQQTLLGGRWLGRGAPWQAALPKELRAFWADMEERARR